MTDQPRAATPQQSTIDEDGNNRPAARRRAGSAPAPYDPLTVALLQSQYDNMLSCIRCGLCLSVCPTYQISFAEEEGPRGRIAMARAVAEGHLPLTPDMVEHSQTCLLCDACTAVCPAGVRMEPLGAMMREVFLRNRPPGPGGRFVRWIVFDRLFGDMRRFRFACRLGWVYAHSGVRGVLRRTGLLRVLGLSRLDGLLPAMPRRFLVPRGQRWRSAGGPWGTPGRPSETSSETSHDVDRQGQVALFTGCIMSTAFAESDRATARMLARTGAEVVAVAEQGCCGALHVHNGEAEGARKLARRNVDAFAALPDAPIVVNAAGCGSTLKGYAHLLHDDQGYAEKAAAFAGRVRDVNEALLAGCLPPPPHPLNVTVTLQEPCHLAHAQRIREAPRRLLAALPGVQLIEMDESAVCCGSAGVYNVLHRGQADTLQERKALNARKSGAEIVVTSNPGCQLQVEAGLRQAGANAKVTHIVDLLDAAYGGLTAGDVIELPPRTRGTG